jgi:hypothetical protein
MEQQRSTKLSLTLTLSGACTAVSFEYLAFACALRMLLVPASVRTLTDAAHCRDAVTAVLREICVATPLSN